MRTLDQLYRHAPALAGLYTTLAESCESTTVPIYEYACRSCGHRFETIRKASEGPLNDCPECERPALRKLVSAPVFRLKGAGWYETDFKTNDQRNVADNGAGKEGGGDRDAAGASGGEEGGQRAGDAGADKAGGEGGKQETGAQAGKGEAAPDKKSQPSKAAPSKPTGDGAAKPAPKKPGRDA